MSRRRTIGESPLDAVVPEQPEARSADQEQSPPETETAEKPRRVAKERLTVHLPVALIERVKNAVYWTPGLTLAALAEQGLLKAVAVREEDRGEPFPQRESELKGGRPLQ